MSISATRARTRAAAKAAIAVAAALAGATQTMAIADAEERSVGVGQSFEIAIKGNPSTGYRWQVNGAASSGLAAVGVTALGYASSGGPPGAPADYRFRIACVKAGKARIAFLYRGPTGAISAKSHAVSVRCK